MTTEQAPSDLNGLYRLARTQLRQAALTTADLDARLLVCAALGEDRMSILRYPDRPVSREECDHCAGLIARRLSGEPVSRILNKREFWGLPFALSPATLDPRPDTETIVAETLELLSRQSPRRPKPRILDLGTGSGCILLALLHSLSDAWGVGTDRSHQAIATAHDNSVRLGLKARASFVCCDWDGAVNGPFDVIVANPPYIPTGDIARLMPEVLKFDPIMALDGGTDGLAAAHQIIPMAWQKLRPGGWFVMEIGAGQAKQVSALFSQTGFRPDPAISPHRRDLAGHIRVVTMQRPA
ncbi:MAG: peptide chain release factor N(5)-glutamine methyltransferase [Hyphomicrobiales bacterium]